MGRSIASLTAAAALATSQALACDVKMVFDRWCLGAPVAEQLRDAKIRSDRTADGARYIVIAGESPLMLVVVGQHLSGVSSHFPKPSMTLYQDLQRRIAEQYGLGQDRSEYPRSASTPQEKANAITARFGRASHVWEMEKYMIELIWADEQAILVSYFHRELSDQALQHRLPPSK